MADWINWTLEPGVDFGRRDWRREGADYIRTLQAKLWSTERTYYELTVDCNSSQLPERVTRATMVQDGQRSQVPVHQHPALLARLRNLKGTYEPILEWPMYPVADPALRNAVPV